MTRWISSEERFAVMPETVDWSDGPLTGCAISQSLPFFLSAVRSPDSDLISSSSILSASMLKTLSFFGASSTAPFFESRYAYQPSGIAMSSRIRKRRAA